MHRPQIILAIALAAAAGAASLSACGGGGDQPSSVESRTATNAGRVERKHPKEVAKPEKGGSRFDGMKGGESQSPHPPKMGTKAKAAHGKSPEAKRQEPEGCPKQISRRECAELAEAIDNPKAAKGQTTSANECPPALSKKVCEEIAEKRDQDATSHQAPSEECPPALSNAQCQELKSAYEKAAR